MVGIDILDLERLDTSDSFMKKIAFDEEIEYVLKSPCDSLVRQRLGALFCVKEAVMKALEMGKDSGVSFKDIKLCHKENGKPFIELFGKAREKFDAFFYGKTIEVSISHSPLYATAIAVIM